MSCAVPKFFAFQAPKFRDGTTLLRPWTAKELYCPYCFADSLKNAVLSLKKPKTPVFQKPSSLAASGGGGQPERFHVAGRR